MHNSGTNVTRQSILANAKSGIIAKSGTEPAKTLERFKEEARESQKKDVKGLGWLVTLISIIVTAVVMIVKMVVTAVQAKREAEAQQYIDSLDLQAPTEDELRGACPEHDDYLIKIEQTKRRIADSEEKIQNTWLWSGLGVFATAVAGLVLVKLKLKRKLK
jgi:ABC-type sugar transport system permease subunit